MGVLLRRFRQIRPIRVTVSPDLAVRLLCLNSVEPENSLIAMTELHHLQASIDRRKPASQCAKELFESWQARDLKGLSKSMEEAAATCAATADGDSDEAVRRGMLRGVVDGIRLHIFSCDEMGSRSSKRMLALLIILRHLGRDSGN